MFIIEIGDEEMSRHDEDVKRDRIVALTTPLSRLPCPANGPSCAAGGRDESSVSEMTALAAKMPEVEPTYRPSDDEPFMNDRQLAYFRGKLLAWKEDILRESKGTVVNLKAETENHPDLVDRASSESDRALELRTRDRQRKLISKIDEALRRIDDGSYGYCEETGEPISLGRLEARPTATLSVEAQERHERRERVHRDD
jgi:DnaK suppressor protein